MSETAESGYFVCLKLTLVDTAFEALEHAIGVDPVSITVTDSSISARLWRQCNRELTSAFESLKNRKLSQQCRAFLDTDESFAEDFDVRVLLPAFRHLTAHGEFNPSASGLYTSEHFRLLLFALADADAGSRRCEAHFMEHLELASGPSEPEVNRNSAGTEVVVDLSDEALLATDTPPPKGRSPEKVSGF